MEYKIVIYILALALVLRVIARYICKKDDWNWDSFKEIHNIGVTYYFLKYALIIYAILRFIIIPLSI